MLGKYNFRARRRRTIRTLLVGIFLWLVIDLLSSLQGYRVLNQNLIDSTIDHREQLPAAIRNQKIFIAAQFWTSADILRDHWQAALLELIDALGKDNVYLSIVATKGLDNTDEILRQLDMKQLTTRNVSRTIVIDPSTHEDEIRLGAFDADLKPRPGWLYTGDSYPPGRKELRRIPYLAGIRNRSLAPLIKLQEEQGIRFDKILYLGDVIFRPSDVLTLLGTNQGSFDVACSIDYRLDNRFYDTFVLRDATFQVAATRIFPFFRSSASRAAVLKGLPVPVTSCWNGMVISDAAFYYNKITKSSEYPHTSSDQLESISGLRFRGIPDTLASLHVEASESCLIHADAIAQGYVTKGIFMNPAVRVGYTRWGFQTTAYDDVHIGPKGLGWVTLKEYLHGIWTNRRARWKPSNWLSGSSSVKKKVAQWKAEGKKMNEDRQEVGDYCLINEMQILTTDGKGWKHIGGQAEY